MNERDSFRRRDGAGERAPAAPRRSGLAEAPFGSDRAAHGASLSETRTEKRERQRTEGSVAMAEHEAMRKKVDERTAALRALRLAREAAEADAEASAPARKSAAKKRRKPFTQS